MEGVLAKCNAEPHSNRGLSHRYRTLTLGSPGIRQIFTSSMRSNLSCNAGKMQRGSRRTTLMAATMSSARTPSEAMVQCSAVPWN